MQHLLNFPSLPAVIDYINTTPARWRSTSSRSNYPSQDWDLSAGYEGALKLADLGWNDGARNLASGLERLRPQAIAYYRKFSVAGTRLSMAKYVSGNPRCMWRKEASEGPKPAIRLAVCVSANSNVDAAHMANYGLAIASYAEQLENAGYKVEILVALPNEMKGRVDCCWTWIVKPLHGRMNFSDVAFSIGHPACYRRIGFALFERAPCNDVAGYGTASDLKRRHLPKGNDYIILNGMRSAGTHSRTPEAALHAIAKTISTAMEEQGLV